MPVNEFQTFALGGGAVVQPIADYEVNPAVTSGYQVGIADPAQCNRTWRQAAFWAKILGDLINLITGQDVRDDGDVAGKDRLLWQAWLMSHFFVDVGAAGVVIINNPTGLTFPAPTVGIAIDVLIAHTNTGAATMGWMGTTSPIIGWGGNALSGGELVAGTIVSFTFDGTSWRVRTLPDYKLAHGECYFEYISTTQCRLVPRNGNNLIVGSVQRQIPSAGLNLSNSGLAANTDYYVIAQVVSGALVLATVPVSGNTHAPDISTANVGVEVIWTGGSPVSGQTLVGRVRTDGSGNFIQVLSNLTGPATAGVTSWFNRRFVGMATGPVTASTGSLTQVELNSLYRVNAVTFGEDSVILDLNGSGLNSIGTDSFQAYPGIDGVPSGDASTGSGSSYQTVLGSYIGPVAEGYHTFGLFGSNGNTGGTATFQAGLFVGIHL